MRRGGNVFAVLAVLALVLSACGSTISGTAVPAPSSARKQVTPVGELPELPYGKDKALAEAFAVMRTWDVCALHDPEAMKKTLTVEDGSIAPYLDISECKLEVTTDENVTWEASIELGKFGAVYSEEPARQETIGGVRLSRTVERSFGDCTYELPYRKVAAIALTVGTFGSGGRGRACKVAKSYLTDILPRWQRPATVDEGRTTPQPRMLGQDPCKGLEPIRTELEPRVNPDFGLSVSLPNPYDCTLNGSLREGGYQGYQVKFAMTGPGALDDGKRIEVAGLQGVREAYVTCTYRFDLGSDPISLGGQFDTRDEIEVSFTDCAQSEQALEQILRPYQQALAAKPAQPAAGATPLGDLDPPSTPQQLGAPFDPCTVLSWADFPAEMAGQDPSEPQLAELSADDPNVQTGCSYRGEGMTTVIGWGKNPLSTLLGNPEFTEGGARSSVGDRERIRFDDTTDNGRRSCTEFVSMSKGVLALHTIQNDGNLAPCMINDKLVLKLINKVR